jgi:hypothetical protein
MKKPAGTSIIESLKSRRRGRDRTGATATHWAMHGAQARIQGEVLNEMGAALKRSADKVEALLEKLDRLDKRIQRERDPDRRVALIDTFNTVRGEALEARRHYVIQREAVGFRQNDIVYEEYPVPRKRILPAGPNGEDGTLTDASRCSS